MNPTLQLAITVLGWIVVFWISNRSLRRNETSRVKDNLIDKLIDLSKYFERFSVPGIEVTDNLQIEEILSSRCSQIELYLDQMNYRVGKILVAKDFIVKLRNIDISNFDQPQARIVTATILDFIAEVETRFMSEFLEASVIKELCVSLWRERYALLGAILGCILLLLMFNVLSFIISNA